MATQSRLAKAAARVLCERFDSGDLIQAIDLNEDIIRPRQHRRQRRRQAAAVGAAGGQPAIVDDGAEQDRCRRDRRRCRQIHAVLPRSGRRRFALWFCTCQLTVIDWPSLPDAGAVTTVGTSSAALVGRNRLIAVADCDSIMSEGRPVTCAKPPLALANVRDLIIVAGRGREAVRQANAEASRRGRPRR